MHRSELGSGPCSDFTSSGGSSGVKSMILYRTHNHPPTVTISTQACPSPRGPPPASCPVQLSPSPPRPSRAHKDV